MEHPRIIEYNGAFYVLDKSIDMADRPDVLVVGAGSVSIIDVLDNRGEYPAFHSTRIDRTFFRQYEELLLPRGCSFEVQEIVELGRQIANYNPDVKVFPSRRGRHLKPDDSRRARYSTSSKK